MPNEIDPVAGKIAKHGWAVVNVDGDAEVPNYSYSVGLYETFRHPEVIVFGLATTICQQIINAIGEKVRTGTKFSANEVSKEVLEGYSCAFRAVAPAAEHAYMGVGIDHYGHTMPALHCIWPDKEGRFPWERGTTPDYRRLQPMLSDGPEPHTTVRPA